jgi:hypothetical protein
MDAVSVQHADTERRARDEENGTRQQEARAQCERLDGPPAQDALNAARQVGPPNTRGKRRWCTKGKATHLEDCFSVSLRICSHLQHLFVTGTFALESESRAYPPDHRMKPEQDFHHDVHQRTQIVLAADVTDLVCEDRVELGIGKAFRQPEGPQEPRAEDTSDGGFAAAVA